MDNKNSVTPEMLLFLAEKMGLPNPIISQCPNTEHRCYLRHGDGLTNVFWPHKNRIQWADVVVWAWQNGVVVDNRDDSVLTEFDGGPTFIVDHDSTPDSIRAAAVVAICRALGYEEEREWQDAVAEVASNTLRGLNGDA